MSRHQVLSDWTRELSIHMPHLSKPRVAVLAILSVGLLSFRSVAIPRCAWCEQGFKRLKRGGWQWQHTRMTDPARVARMWLTLAVATLWTVTLGSQVENGPSPEWLNLRDLRPLLGGVIAGVRRRRTRLVRLGWLWLIAQLSKIYPPPLPRQRISEPWPGPPEGRWPLAPPPPMQKTYPWKTSPIPTPALPFPLRARRGKGRVWEGLGEVRRAA